MSEDARPALQRGKPRVLVVDDAPGMRAYLGLVMDSAGLPYVEAANGDEAFDAILEGGIDLVITDLEMPGMDGYQLLSAISLLPVSRGRPAVIVASARLDDTTAMRRPELRQAAALLAKPVPPADLLKAIQKVFPDRVISR